MVKRTVAAEKKPRKSAKAKESHAGNGGNGRPLSASDNSAPPAGTTHEERERFHVHRQTWNALQARQKVLDSQWRDAKAALKADGFQVKQMQIADMLAGSPKQEAKVRVEVEDRLKVAWWMGHPMGSQLDLFARPGTVAAAPVDSAYNLGKVACMSGQRASPPEGYAPGSEHHNAWLSGYHDQQAKMVRDGIKPIEPTDDAEDGGDSHEEISPDDVEVDEEDPAGWGESRLPPAARGGTDL